MYHVKVGYGQQPKGKKKQQLKCVNDYPKGSWARRSPFLEISETNLSWYSPIEHAMHRCNTQHPCLWVAISTQNLAAATKINCKDKTRTKKSSE